SARGGVRGPGRGRGAPGRHRVPLRPGRPGARAGPGAAVDAGRASRPPVAADAAGPPPRLPDLRGRDGGGSPRVLRLRSNPLVPGPPGSALLSLALLLIVAPLLPGVAARTRAVLTGRRGAPVHQLYVDLWKLLRRGVVYSTTTTAIFRLAPVAVAATAVLAAAQLPLNGTAGVLRFSGDALAFAYL